jgi:DNA-binding NarL/FixJ family response regulator
MPSPALIAVFILLGRQGLYNKWCIGILGKLFRNRHPDRRIAIVADHYRLKDLTAAFRAGANGYFVNVITCDRFVKSVELVIHLVRPSSGTRTMRTLLFQISSNDHPATTGRQAARDRPIGSSKC